MHACERWRATRFEVELSEGQQFIMLLTLLALAADH